MRVAFLLSSILGFLQQQCFPSLNSISSSSPSNAVTPPSLRSTFPFQQLPVEIQQDILALVREDLNASPELTCKSFHSILGQHLHRELCQYAATGLRSRPAIRRFTDLIQHRHQLVRKYIDRPCSSGQDSPFDLALSIRNLPFFIVSIGCLSANRCEYRPDYSTLLKNLLRATPEDAQIIANSRFPLPASPHVLLGDPWLLIAAKSKNWLLLKLLLASGADIQARDHWGETALMWSVIGKDSLSFDIQLSHPDVPLNAVNDEGRSALYYAVLFTNDEMVRRLCERPDLQFDDGSSASMVRMMRDRKNPLIMAITKECVECARWLVKRMDMNVNYRTESGTTAVHHAAESLKALGILELILEERANDVDVSIRDYAGRTARDYALENGNLEAVALLQEFEQR